MTKPVTKTVESPRAKDATNEGSSTTQAFSLLGGRFRLRGMLGGGGMGNVYLAHDTELDEDIAIKVLKPALSRRHVQLAHLRREVKLSRRVTHANVVRTYDIGVHDDAKFLTMELVTGGTLADLSTRPMPLAELLRVALAVCSGLAAAHEAGVLHLDLKPTNVLLGTDGRIALTDFGIAQLADDAAAGVMGGTPGYMAPERLAGAPVDGRADIWSLGALLYEMATGTRAFARPRGGLGAVVDRAPDPHDLRADLPLALARVVTRCMALAPAARFTHPREVAAALGAALEHVARGSIAPPDALVVTRRPRVLVVLPLENLGSPDDGYLADGLTAVLIDAVDSREIEVPSRGAVEAARPAGRDALAVGRELGAEAIVTGTVARSSPGEVHLTLRLVGTGDGLALLVEDFTCKVADVVRVIEGASRSIARALLVARDDAPLRTRDAEAVELYLQGLQHYRRRWAHDVERAVDCFRRALERIPDDPLLLSAHAVALARHVTFAGPASGLDEARVVSLRARAIAPERPESHLAVAAVHLQLGEAALAARAIVSALAVAPREAEVHHFLGLLTSEVASTAEALAQLYTALTLDPSLDHARWWIGRAHALLGDGARSDAIFAEPPAEPARRNDYWVDRARAVAYAPTPERVALFDRALADAPDFETKPAVVAARTLFDRKTPLGDVEVGAIIGAGGGSARRRSYLATLLAEAMCARGEWTRALDAMREADAAAWVDIVWLDTCPLVVPLHGSADFEAIRDRVRDRAAPVRAILERKA